jgi:hypothetical protein
MGEHKKIFDISPGNCDWVDWYTPDGRKTPDAFCKKHQMPCSNGCIGTFHMKIQKYCKSCEFTFARKESEQRKAHEKAQKDAMKQRQEADVWAKHSEKNAKTQKKKKFEF